MRTALPIPAFARGRSPKLFPPGRQSPYHFTIGKRMDAIQAARSDPNAFVDFMLKPELLPGPKIDWSALPACELIMAPIGNAMSGKTG